MALSPLVPHRAHYGDRAPIIEALIDLAFDPEPRVSLEDLRAWGGTPSQVITQWEGRFQQEPGDAASMSTTQRTYGFIFRPSSTHALQVRRDGFTFSLLHPYTHWADLRDRTREAWDRFRPLVGDRPIRRVTHRCINRILLPPSPHLPDWFHVHPTSPPALGTPGDLLLRLALTHPERPDLTAHVTLGTLPQEADVAPFLFDIDVHASAPPADDDGAWDTLDDLHQFRNDVFFGCLTPATLEGFTS